MNQTFSDVVFWVVIPLVAAGISAILSYYLTKRSERKKQNIISLSKKVIDYSLAQEEKGFSSLEVSYRGNQYPRLSFCETKIKNIGLTTISDCPFVLILDDDARIIDKAIQIAPVPGVCHVDQKELPIYMNRFTVEEIHPNDEITIKLLISNTNKSDWNYRGAQVIEIQTDEKFPSSLLIDSDLLRITFLFSLYVLAGSIPFLSEIIRAFLVLAIVPFLFRVIKRVMINRDASPYISIGKDVTQSVISLGGEFGDIYIREEDIEQNLDEITQNDDSKEKLDDN